MLCQASASWWANSPCVCTTQPLLPTAWSLNLYHSSCFSDPPDDELGAHSGCATDYMCENPSCSRAFHSVCLRDWLRSITTTRQYVWINPSCQNPHSDVVAVFDPLIILSRAWCLSTLCWQVVRCPVRELPLLQRSRRRQDHRPLTLYLGQRLQSHPGDFRCTLACVFTSHKGENETILVPAKVSSVTFGYVV